MTFSGLILIFKQTALKYDLSWFSGFLSLEANALFTYRHLWLWGSTVTEKCLVWDGYASGKGQSAQWSRWSQEERAVPREYRSGTQGSMAVDGCGGVQNILGVRNSRKKAEKNPWIPWVSCWDLCPRYSHESMGLKYGDGCWRRLRPCTSS